MSYSIVLDSRVAKDLAKHEPGVLKRIDAAIRRLGSNPRPAGSKKLQGRISEAWRVRVGNYRILYHIRDERREVIIYKIGHRSEVYR